MPLKRLYKQLVPEGVRNRVAGHPWVERLRNRQLVREGQRLASAARMSRKPDNKIRVAFVVQRPALWCNHASIYEAMKADPVFEVSVLAIPKRPPAAAEPDLEEYERLMEFLEGKGIAFFKGYDIEGRTWINPLRFGLPDIVFLPQPYAFTQGFLYHSVFLKHFCDIAIVPYGATIAYLPVAQYQLPVYSNCRFIFLQSEAHKALFADHRPELINRLVVTGHPKMDLYQVPLPPNKQLWKLTDARKRIIWAPHFTVGDDQTPHTFSNFFKYYDNFVRYAQQHPDVEFVLRPHPDLFSHMVALGLKTREAAEEYRRQFNALPNGQIYSGGDIFLMFRQSDALILDSISFLAEYAPTGKPICFLDSARRQRLNPLGERLLHAYYVAWDEAEIEEFIERVVLNGDDWRQQERLATIHKQLYIPSNGSGVAIAEHIRTSLRKARL